MGQVERWTFKTKIYMNEVSLTFLYLKSKYVLFSSQRQYGMEKIKQFDINDNYLTLVKKIMYTLNKNMAI